MALLKSMREFSLTHWEKEFYIFYRASKTQLQRFRSHVSQCCFFPISSFLLKILLHEDIEKYRIVQKTVKRTRASTLHCSIFNKLKISQLSLENTILMGAPKLLSLCVNSNL